MKLNPNCVREILLAVEETSEVGVFSVYMFRNDSPCSPQGNPILIGSQYNVNEIIYHIRQCQLSGLLYDVKLYTDMYIISDLSPKGHEFLANTRKNEIWTKTKSIAEKIGCISLDAFLKISSNVITELIKHEFGIL